MTNWDSVAEIAGDDTIDWPGHRVELFPSTTTMKGSTVGCIRIRPSRQRDLLPRPQPPQKPKAKPPTPPDNDMSDDIPF